MTATATDYITRAKDKEKQVNDSIDSSDTDGFLSQWASALGAQQDMLRAELAANDGYAEFPALFDTDGNLIPAKLINTTYGNAWGLLPGNDPTESFTSYFNPSKARGESQRISNDAKKGYYVGTVSVLSAVGTSGSGTGLSGLTTVRPVIYRLDKGFSIDAVILDNGK